jgi:hypothetical protein
MPSRGTELARFVFLDAREVDMPETFPTVI